MIMVTLADLQETPGVFIQKNSKDMLIINQNESPEVIGKMIKEHTTYNKKPALTKEVSTD